MNRDNMPSLIEMHKLLAEHGVNGDFIPAFFEFVLKKQTTVGEATNIIDMRQKNHNRSDERKNSQKRKNQCILP